MNELKGHRVVCSHCKRMRSTAVMKPGKEDNWLCFDHIECSDVANVSDLREDFETVIQEIKEVRQSRALDRATIARVVSFRDGRLEPNMPWKICAGCAIELTKALKGESDNK